MDRAAKSWFLRPLMAAEPLCGTRIPGVVFTIRQVAEARNKGPLQRTNCSVCDNDSDVQNSHRPGGSELQREVVNMVCILQCNSR